MTIEWSFEGLPTPVEADRRRVIDAFRASPPDFTKLPGDVETARTIERSARRLRRRFRSVVHLGIGGSGLGASTLLSALAPRGAIPVRVLDNVDPEEAAAVIGGADARTLFHVVSKSGGTTETLAAFLAAIRRCGRDWTKRVVVTTDPEHGFLRELAKRHGLAALDVPPGVGGRFSVLTAVGLFPAAMAGIPIRRVLAGAAGVTPESAFDLAWRLWHLDRTQRRNIVVVMPYARALKDFSAWFVQLWAESLGKRADTGPTPLPALGATDQHSLLQLLQEGPADKVVWVLGVRRFRRDLKVPPVFRGREPATALLEGLTFAQILEAERQGTVSALRAAGRPVIEAMLPAITPEAVGALLYTCELATEFAGALYGVSPDDQPGVEASKRETKRRLEELRTGTARRG